MCDYERQRAERIARNEQILQEMGIVCSMDAFSAAGRKLNAANRKRNTANNKSRSPSRKSERLCAPTRTSLRIQGQSPEVQAVLLLEPRCGTGSLQNFCHLPSPSHTSVKMYVFFLVENFT